MPQTIPLALPFEYSWLSVVVLIFAKTVKNKKKRFIVLDSGSESGTKFKMDNGLGFGSN